MSFNYITFKYLEFEYFLYKTRNCYAYSVKTIGLTSKKRFSSCHNWKAFLLDIRLDHIVKKAGLWHTQ